MKTMFLEKYSCMISFFYLSRFTYLNLEIFSNLLRMYSTCGQTEPHKEGVGDECIFLNLSFFKHNTYLPTRDRVRKLLITFSVLC